MKNVLYLIIVGITIYSGAKLRPDIIIANNGLSFVMAVVIYSLVSAYLANLIINLLTQLTTKEADKNDVLIVIVISSIAILITSILSLVAVETIIPNFKIVGAYSKLLIAFIATLSISLISYHDILRQ